MTDDSLVQCLVEIRRVLGPDEHLIRTVRGRGYRFEAEVTAPSRARVVAGPLAAPELAPAGPAALAVGDARRGGPAPQVDRAEAPVWRGRRLLWLVPVLLAGALSAAWLWPGLPAAGLHSRQEPPAVRQTGLGASTAIEAARAQLAAGRAAANELTRAGLNRAVVHIEEALHLAPDYADAWVELARSLTLLHIFGAAEPASVLPRARDAATRAVQLDPTLAGAHAALAHVQEQWDRDWAGAEASHRQALALNPQSAQFHQMYSLFLVTQARYDEATAMADRARALAPTSARVHATRGVLEVLAGHPERALEACAAALALDPSSSLASFWQAVALMELGRLDEALAAAIASGADAANEPTLLVGVVHARAGRREDALLVRRAIEAKAAVTYVPATEFAVIDAALGDTEGALDWLERGFDERARWMAAIAHTPLLRSLHGHPRFTRLVERLGLPSPPAGT